MGESVKTDVVVVGAGLNGLVAGAWLARRGRSVIVLDQRPEPGGAAVTTEFAPGFRAPTLSHALGPVSADVLAALGIDAGPLGFVVPDPALTTIGLNGESVSFHQDVARTAAAIGAVSARDAAAWPAFAATYATLGSLAGSLAAQPAPSIDQMSSRDWWRMLQLGRRTRRLSRRDLITLARWTPMAVADLVSERFESDLVQGAIAAHAIFGNLAGPRSAGTGGMLLQRAAADPLPVGSSVTMAGGPGALSQVIAQAATRAGAVVRTGARVVRIDVHDGRAAGVTLDSGETLPARVVLASVHPKQATLELLQPDDLPTSFRERMRHSRARGVTAKINLALSSAPRFPALGGSAAATHGRLLVAPDLDYLEHAFDAAKYGGCSREPWLDVAVPTAGDPSLAPPGQHVMSIHAHFAPYHLREGRWPDAAEGLHRSVIAVLERVCPGVEAAIVGRQMLTPADLEAGWGLPGGHIFHGEPTMDQSWIARPLLGWAQNETPVAGLFLGSAGSHPGGGLTGLPGLLAAQAVDRCLRGGTRPREPTARRL
jgi:phytoene dehydrogenase-like protein